MGDTQSAKSAPDNVPFEERVAVVALALAEGDSPQPVGGLKARSLDGRAVERLGVVAQGAAMQALLERLGSWPRTAGKIALVVIVLAVSAGLAAVVSWQEVVSVPTVLIGTLGIQSVLLLAWLLALLPITGPVLRRVLAALVTGPARTLGAAGAWVGREVRTRALEHPDVARHLRRAGRSNPLLLACTGALAVAYSPANSRLTALVYGVWSNGAWTAANALVLILLSLRLVASHTYTLHSGLLSPEVTRSWAEAVTHALGVIMPSSMLPDAEAMARASASPQGAPGDSWRWGCMLVASVAVFGLAPRIACLLLSAMWLRSARHRWGIPWTDPRMALTRAVIESSQAPIEVIGRERPAVVETPVAGAAVAASVRRPVMTRLGGVSIWPAPLAAEDLGALDEEGLQGVARIVEELRRNPAAPLLLFADLAMAPRLGIIDYLAPLAKTCGGACVLILSEGARLRRGENRADARVLLDAWHDLARRAGIQSVLEIDLAFLTSRSQAMVAALATGHSVQAGAAGKLREACARILDESAGWKGEPGVDSERRLLSQVAAAFGAERLLERAPFVALLTDGDAWLRRRWRGVATSVKSTWKDPGARAEKSAALTAGEVLRNALLLAVELELQGCGEIAIAEAVEAAAQALGDGPVPDAAARSELVEAFARLFQPASSARVRAVTRGAEERA